MKFIEAHDANGCKIAINANSIVSFRPSNRGRSISDSEVSVVPGTLIFFNNSDNNTWLATPFDEFLSQVTNL